jgi:hypothetical protein
MDTFICTACGTQYMPSQSVPQHCVICQDERQYIPHQGQRWTTMATMIALTMLVRIPSMNAPAKRRQKPASSPFAADSIR